MKRSVLIVGAVSALCGASASATPVLQLDVNSIGIQCRNPGGGPSAFGGLSHTGSVSFTLAASTILNGVFIQSVVNGPFNNAGFNGTISNFVGVVNLVNGQVTGGQFSTSINANTDSYSCSIVPNVGQVSTYVGGGFKIEGLTFQGFFSDAQFGNVNVAPWFNAQGASGLPGSFLQFNFDPNASGAGFADVDMFVDTVVVPVPQAVWSGMAMLAGLVTVGVIRRRR